MDTSNKDFQKGFLFCLHLQKCTAESAHAQLLKVTEGDVFSLDEVKQLFNEIDSGEYKDNEKVQNPKHLLQNMPYTVHKDIVEYLDLKSRLTLRKTSRQFRDFVDKAEFHIKDLTIRYNSSNVSITDNNGLLVKYDKIHERCVVKHNNQLWLDKDKSYIECAKNDLKAILHMEKLTLDYLNFVDVKQNGRDEDEELKELISELLSSREKKLQVKYLTMEHSQLRGLKYVLPHLDPHSIKGLKLSCQRGIYIQHISLKSFGADQWRNVESLICNHWLKTSEFLEKCTHFSYSKTRLRDLPTVNDVMRIKDKLLLNNPILNQIKIYARMKNKEFNEINRQLQTLNRPGTKNPTWAHFNYPNSPNKRLSMCVTNKMIWFKGPCFVENESVVVESDFNVFEGDSDSDDSSSDEDD